MDVGNRLADGCAALLALQHDFLAVDHQGSHRRHHGRCAGEDGFRAVFRCGLQFGHSEVALAHFIAQIGGHAQYGIAGYAVQEFFGERLGDDFVAVNQREVGGAGFLHVAVRAEQYLVGAVLLAGAYHGL